MPDLIRLDRRGLRGESAADVARRTGAWGAAPDATDLAVLEAFADFAIAENPGFQGPQGNPGGNVTAIGAKTGAGALTIPVGTDIVQTSGYSSSAAGGAARYAFDAALTDADVTANGFTMFKSANGRRFKLAEPVVTPEMFGAIGDGVTNDATALQAMFNHLASLKRVGVARGVSGKTYKSNNGLICDVFYVDIDGGLVLDFTGLTGTYGLTLTSSYELTLNPTVMRARRPRVRGLTLKGSGATNGKTAIRVTVAAGDRNNSMLRVEDFAVDNFDLAVQVDEHAFGIEFAGFSILECARGFYKTPGIDAGERTKLRDGVFNSVGVCLRVNDQSADWYVENVSFDYNGDFGTDMAWIIADQGSVRAKHCHFEAHKPGSSPWRLGQSLFRMGAVNTAEIELESSWISFSTGLAGVRLFENANTEKAFIARSCYMLLILGGADGFMGTGRAVLDLIYIDGGGFHGNALLTTAAENLNKDDFTGAAPNACFSVREGGENARLGTGTSLVALATSGGKLRITKRGAGGAGAASVSIVFPVSGAQAVAGSRFTVTKDGALTGTLSVDLYWASGYKDGNGVFRDDPGSTVIGGDNMVLTGAAASKTFNFGGTNARKPAWATHLLAIITLSGIDGTVGGAGTIDVSPPIATLSRGN